MLSSESRRRAPPLSLPPLSYRAPLLGAVRDVPLEEGTLPLEDGVCSGYGGKSRSPAAREFRRHRLSHRWLQEMG